MNRFHLIGLEPIQEKGLAELKFPQSVDGILVRVRQGTVCRLEKKDREILFTYTKPHSFYRLLSMLPDFAAGEKPCFEERSRFDMLCYMADQSRNAVFCMDAARDMIRRLALCGYDSLMLYTEDTYEIPEYPYFGYMRGRYTKEELKELDRYAQIFGIELIPCIQTLAHLESVLPWDCFASIRDNPDNLMVGEEESYRLIDRMIAACAECFTSRRINIGLDEALMLGRGNYLKKNGYHPSSELMLAHLDRVRRICQSYGFSVMMWSDMFFRMVYNGWYHECTELLPQEVADSVPADVTPIYWDYGSTDEIRFRNMAKSHLRFRAPATFAGGVGKFHGFAPANRVSIKITEMQLDLCHEAGITNIIATGWGDGGAEASQFSGMPTMLYYAERAFCDRPKDAWMDQRAKQCFEIGYPELLLTDLPNEMGEGVTGEKQVVNPCKYLLFNDPLMGLMDQNLIPESVSEVYRVHATRLQPLCTHPTWGYLYKMLYCLCDLLSVKAELSRNIRAAYHAADRGTLHGMVQETFPCVIEKLDAFIAAFEAQWMKENRPFGFEIQLERLGGLRLRLVQASKRIAAYLAGELTRIEELEAEQLPFRECNPAHPYFKCWDASRAVTPAKQHW